MPLSKARMRARKRQDRAKKTPSRFDGTIRGGYVKPSSPFKTVVTDAGELVEFDADGNRIYED